jgi:hypothetical protein
LGIIQLFLMTAKPDKDPVLPGSACGDPNWIRVHLIFFQFVKSWIFTLNFLLPAAFLSASQIPPRWSKALAQVSGLSKHFMFLHRRKQLNSYLHLKCGGGGGNSLTPELESWRTS